MNNTKFKKGLSGSQKAMKGFQKQIQNIGGMIAGAFAISALTSFGKEAVKLAAQMEGVEAAFNNLGRPGLLADLQKSTRNTVTNLELMKAAVQAKNFKIPLEELAGFFEFATNRAIQTGESVDFLVNSIITGIGRKSVLVMDNLGISAVELQEEVRKVGDFGLAAGNIISRELEAAGDVADTLATQIAQITTAWDNFKASVGDSKVIVFTIRNIGEALDSISKLLNRGAGAALAEYQEFSEVLKDKSATEQQGLLTAEIERQRKVLEGLAKQRREQIKLANDERRVVRQFAETEIKKLDDIQTPLIEILRFFEGQLGTIGDINTELDVEKKTAEEIFKAWVKVNDAVRDRINLQENLNDAVREGLAAQIKGILEANKKRLGAAPSFFFGDEEEEDMPAEAHDALLDSIALARKKFEDMKARMEALQKDTNQMLESFVEQGLTNIFAGLGESLLTKDFENFFASILKMFGSFMVQMGGMITAYGIAMEAFKKAFTNPFAAIAAGIALAAIGGAIIGASKSLSSMGGGSISPRSNPYSGNTIDFRIQGNDLVTVLNRNNYSNNLNT